MKTFYKDGDDENPIEVTPDPVIEANDIGDEFGEKVGEHNADERSA